MGENVEEKNVDGVLLYGPYPNRKQLVLTEHIFSLWHVKIREFEWEISFGLMKSGVWREMVITL